MTYLDNWEDSVMKREGNFIANERQFMMLSKETRFGLRLTGLQMLVHIPVCRY